VIAIAVVAVGLTIRSARRGFGDRESVDAHHRALDTLAEIAAHRSTSMAQGSDADYRTDDRPVRPDPATEAGRPARAPRHGPGRTGQDRGDRPAGSALAPPELARSLGGSTNRSRGTARRHSPSHRRRGGTAPHALVALVAALVVVAAAVVVGLAMIGGGHGGPPSAQRSLPPPTVPGPTTPTTALAPVVPISHDSQGARFRLAQPGAVIELAPVSVCWVQIRIGSATGQVVFTGTLRPGDRRPLPAGQAIWLRIGNPPGMAIRVNGTPLEISAPDNSQPYNVVFDPAG